MADVDRDQVSICLSAAQELQTQFWSALSELEDALGGDCDELDLGSTDLSGYDADSLIVAMKAGESDDENETEVTNESH